MTVIKFMLIGNISNYSGPFLVLQFNNSLCHSLTNLITVNFAALLLYSAFF